MGLGMRTFLELSTRKGAPVVIEIRQWKLKLISLVHSAQ